MPETASPILKRKIISDKNYEEVSNHLEALSEIIATFHEAQQEYEDLDEEEEDYDGETDRLMGEMQEAYNAAIDHVETKVVDPKDEGLKA